MQFDLLGKTGYVHSSSGATENMSVIRIHCVVRIISVHPYLHVILVATCIAIAIKHCIRAHCRHKKKCLKLNKDSGSQSSCTSVVN